VTLTDRDRKLVIGLVPILILAVYWLLLLSPKRDEASVAEAEVTTQQQRLDNARAQLAAAQSAKQSFDASYSQLVRLGKAIPSTVDMPSLLVQLDAAAAGTGIRFTKIATGERVAGEAAAATTTTTPPAGSTSGTTGTPAAAGGATAQSAPGAAAESANTAQQTANQRSSAAAQSGVAPADAQTSTSSGSGLPVGGGTTSGGSATTTTGAALETVPLELEFVGNFFNLADFFHRVKRFVSLTNENVVVSGRLLTVESVRWASDGEVFPQLRAEIKATIYLSPKAQGVTAGATPQGPSTGAPADGTTPAPSTPAAAPTATVTP
jgi:Tfp pilus assembly protein PilO